jgi:hypothetical protein
MKFAEMFSSVLSKRDDPEGERKWNATKWGGKGQESADEAKQETATPTHKPGL